MALELHYLDKLMLTTLTKETSYNTEVSTWDATTCQSLIDYDGASAHELYDDTIVTNADVITGKEFISHQELPRQSVRINYNEPRVKPNTLAALLGLTLGSITSTQDGILIAYRHKIVPGSGVAIPSVGAQTKHGDNGAQYKYTGIKSDNVVFSDNAPYCRCQSALIGSGTRSTATDAFVGSVAENWLRWGDAKIYLRDVTGISPITIPSTPSQTASNLGGSPINISTRVLSWTWTWNNNLVPDFGYRASTGAVRGNFHPTKRSATISFTVECDSADEATHLSYYFTQAQLALELNLNSGTLIAATGAFKYGVIMVLPRLQLTAIPRGETNQLENLTFTANILDDTTNPQVAIWVYDNVPAYLA